MQTTSRSLSCAILLLAASALPAAASTIAVTNLLEPHAGGRGLPASVVVANSFTTAPGNPVEVESIIVSVNRDINQTIDAPITLELYSDNGGQPGSMVAAFTGPPIPANATTPTNLTYTVSGPWNLNPSTTYWVVMHGSTASAEWTYTGTDSDAGLPGWSIGDNHLINVLGFGWTNGGPESMRFGIVVPEPATWLSAASGLLFYQGRRRRSK